MDLVERHHTPAALTRWMGVGVVGQEKGHQHVTYLAGRNPFKAFQLDQTVAEAITMLARKRCHRLPVVNAAGDLVYILSQTSIIQFLNRCAP